MHNSHRSARFRLHEGTADCHQRVDALFSYADLASRAGYEQFLLAQASAFLPAEKSLEVGGIDKVLHDWSSRRRSHLIVQDLVRLGLSIPDLKVTSPLSGVPALLGGAYVLEGSRLGGKMLRRQVSPDLPTAFLSDSFPNGWRTLVAALDEQLTGSFEIDQAVEAARSLFAIFERSGQQMNVKRNADVA